MDYFFWDRVLGDINRPGIEEEEPAVETETYTVIISCPDPFVGPEELRGS